jgi:hypothetical protein
MALYYVGMTTDTATIRVTRETRDLLAGRPAVKAEDRELEATLGDGID